MSEFRRVSPGDSIRQNLTARWYNAVTHPTQLRAVDGPDDQQTLHLGQVVVMVENQSGVDVPRGGVLGLTASLNESRTANYPDHFRGVAPSAEVHVERLAVALEPIPSGKVRRCVIAGAAAVRVDVKDSSHRFAVIKSDEPGFLESAATGEFPIVIPQGSSGLTTAVALLPSRTSSPGTMLLVNVNQNVSAETAEFTVDREYYTVIFGSEGRDFITIDNSLFQEEFTPQQYLPVWKRESDGKYVPDRLGGESTAAMLVVDVQQEQTGDFTVDKEYYRIVFGQEDRDQIDVVNVRAETIAQGTKLPVWKRSSDGKYEPDRAGGTGTQVVGFRLQADLAKDATYANAEIIDRFGNAGTDIVVWNDNLQFSGKGSWTDPAGSHVGFRGFCVATGDTQGDRPVYRIITIEGLMRDIAVQLAADQNDAVADTPVVPLNTTRYGHPWHGRFPEVVSATNQFTASDPLGIAKGAKIGQRFWVRYSVPDDEYHFSDRIEAPTMLHVTLPSPTSASQINVAAANYRVVFGQEDRSTITIDNVWDEEFNGGDRLTVFKRPDGLYEADRAGGAGAATALFITIPSGTFVYDETETYLIPDTAYRVIYGEENRVQVSVVNTFNETLVPGDELVVFKRDADGQYEPDRKGDTISQTMIHVTVASEKSGTWFNVSSSEYRVVFGAEDRGTVTISNVFGETFPVGTKFTAFLNSIGDYEPDRGGQGTGATMVYGTIPTTTSAIDFNVTTYTVVFGTEERDPIPVYNEQAETFVAGARVPLWKRNSDGKYVADRKGSSDATMVVGRCTENVYGEDLTFNISRDLVVFGTETRVLVPVNNRYGEEFQVNEYVPVWKRVSDDVYEPDRKGSGLNIAMVKATVPSDTSSSFTTSSYSVVFGSEVRSSITVNNPYNEQFQAGDVIPCWRRSLDTTYEPDRAAEGGGGTMVIATVPSGTSSDFTTSVYEVVFGSESRSDITVNNTYSEAFESGDLVPCWKRDDDGRYEPDRSGEAAAIVLGTLTQHLGTGQSGSATIPGDTITVTNHTNRPLLRNSSVVIDRRQDWIISSNSPTALSATATQNAPTSAGNFTSWSGLTFSGSAPSADVSEASPTISDVFDVLQFVRSGDTVGFLVRGDWDLVPMQIDLLSRHYEKLSWICGLASAAGGETLSKILGKPQTPSGDLCDPKWFDPPEVKEDSYYENLFDTWIGDWLNVNTVVTPFVRSIDSIDLTETATTIQVQINFTTSTAKLIQPGGNVATNRQGDTPAEEACT